MTALTDEDMAWRKDITEAVVALQNIELARREALRQDMERVHNQTEIAREQVALMREALDLAKKQAELRAKTAFTPRYNCEKCPRGLSIYKCMTHSYECPKCHRTTECIRCDKHKYDPAPCFHCWDDYHGEPNPMYRIKGSDHD